jgi:esterase
LLIDLQLAYKKIGSGYPLIILHGLYGSSDNWFTIGNILAKHFEVYLVDQRNHGKSAHSPEHSYEVMKDDLLEFYHQHNISKAIIIGHSMGGKTAILFSLHHPEMVEKLIIVDIAPKSYLSLTELKSQIVQHLNIMQAFTSVNISEMKSREAIDKAFAEFVAHENVRRFLLKNVKRNEQGNFEWLLNVEALRNALPQIMDGINLKNFVPDKEKMNFPVLFIKGEKSDYITEDDIYAIKQLYPKAEFVTIFEAGHWVHAEQPELFIKTILYFLNVE